MFRRANFLLTIVVLALSASASTAYGLQEKFDLSNNGKKKAREELTAKVLEGRPESTPVISDENYFIEAFKKKRSIGRRKLAMSDIANKEIVFLAFFNELKSIATKDAIETSEKLQTNWEAAEKTLIERLAKEEEDESVIDTEQAMVLTDFFAQWHADVLKADKDRYRDAMLQAAYGLAEAAMGIKKAQAAKAKSSEGSPQGSNAAASRGAGGSGYYPMHERMLNHIYHHHDRQMNRVERIRARR